MQPPRRRDAETAAEKKERGFKPRSHEGHEAVSGPPVRLRSRADLKDGIKSKASDKNDWAEVVIPSAATNLPPFRQPTRDPSEYLGMTGTSLREAPIEFQCFAAQYTDRNNRFVPFVTSWLKPPLFFSAAVSASLRVGGCIFSVSRSACHRSSGGGETEDRIDATRPSTLNVSAWADGSSPSWRRVCVVIGPMLASLTPSSCFA